MEKIFKINEQMTAATTNPAEKKRKNVLSIISIYNTIKKDRWDVIFLCSISVKEK